MAANMLRPLLVGDVDEEQDLTDDTADADILVELETTQFLSTIALAPANDLRLSDDT